MGPNKLIVVAFATLASLITVDAGPCRPSSTSVVTTSASESASSTFSAETSARSLTASEASSVITESESTLTTAESTTTTTEVEGVTTTTAESEKATTTVSTETTINAETSTIASEAETSTTETEGATTKTDEGETLTVATAIATTESSTIISETTTATTTTAEGEPTYLIDPNFDDGTTAPWIVAPNSNPFSLSSQSYQGPASGRQVFGAGPGYPYSNVFYQKIDKKLLKAGAYSLKGYVHVDQYITDDSINGCSYIAASCVAGPPGNLENMFGTSGISGNAGLNWYQMITACSFTEQDLSQYDQFGITFGFTCYNSGVNLDAVTFGPT
ncbi:hypothetical protein FOYG_09110 [Fusarium oxysporum NRRL 32931]|uniref:Uncharacterized protein n=1 Tax=Fusarium oxysporum NRRL 32931 TaxID=660029 RepID=W9HZC9_FUSOX|nr:hypothetical protein FOYG_09110 [Fusarium oxysporum NRRL 32931]